MANNCGLDIGDFAPIVSFQSGCTIGGLTPNTLNCKTLISTEISSLTNLSITGKLGTLSGDLFLNPSGSNIDCGGKNLINIGSLVVNENDYTIISPSQVSIIGAITAPILVIPTVANRSYYIKVRINVVDAVAGDIGYFDLAFYGKNLADIVTISLAVAKTKNVDVGITSVDANVTISGVNILINGVGVALKTTKWFASAEILRATI